MLLSQITIPLWLPCLSQCKEFCVNFWSSVPANNTMICTIKLFLSHLDVFLCPWLFSSMLLKCSQISQLPCGVYHGTRIQCLGIQTLLFFFFFFLLALSKQNQLIFAFLETVYKDHFDLLIYGLCRSTVYLGVPACHGSPEACAPVFHSFSFSLQKDWLCFITSFPWGKGVIKRRESCISFEQEVMNSLTYVIFL